MKAYTDPDDTQADSELLWGTKIYTTTELYRRNNGGLVTNWKALTSEQKKAWSGSMDKFMAAGQRQSELFRNMIGHGKPIEPVEKKDGYRPRLEEERNEMLQQWPQETD